MSRLLELCECSSGFMASCPDYKNSSLVIFGAPMDFTVSFRPGSRSGPQAIRLASPGLEEHSLYSGKDLRDVSFYDAGDVLLPLGNVGRSLDLVEEATATILDDKKIPLLLGGEHLVSLGAMRAAAQRFPNLAVIHFDAHADLRTDYMGEANSHAAVMRRAFDDLGVELFQYGIRSATAEETAFAKQHTHFYPFHVSAPLKETLALLKGRPIYVSIDIDVVDPAYAPGTGTPEPGGITSAELLDSLALLSQLNVVAMDLVEVSPAYDPAGITAMLAAKAVREMILSFAK